jgi:hypothetical protein
MSRADHHPVWKGLVAGLAAGAIASWTMTRFQTALTKLRPRREERGEQASSFSSESASEGEDATTKTAEALAQPVLARRLTRDEKRAAGPLVHYVFGSTVGAAYGAMAEARPAAAAGRGLLFGTALWLGADEVAVPAFGLSKAPLAYPPSTHFNALAAHLVYGVTADIVRRAVRRAL